jgi:hypothetical protein
MQSAQASVAHAGNPATQEAEIRKILVRSQPRQIICQSPSQKRAGGVAQVVGLEVKPQYRQSGSFTFPVHFMLFSPCHLTLITLPFLQLFCHADFFLSSDSLHVHWAILCTRYSSGPEKIKTFQNWHIYLVSRNLYAAEEHIKRLKEVKYSVF